MSNILLNLRMLVLILAALLAFNTASATENPILEDHYAEIYGHTVHYQTGGEGPYLLMLHGFTLTGEQWTPFAEDLAKSHALLIVDLPGHGESDPLSTGFSFPGTASLMLGLLDHLGIQKVNAIGHSAGSITLLHMAMQDQERLEAMALVSGGFWLGEAGHQTLVHDDFYALAPEMQTYYRSIHPGGDAQIEAIFEEERKFASQYPTSPTEAVPFVAQFAALDIPVLLLWGDRDTYFPVEVAIELYQTLPQAQLYVVPNQGHVPLWPEWGGDRHVADSFADWMNQFFSSPPVGFNQPLTPGS